MHPVQERIFRNMTPASKLAVAAKLHHDARRLKEAGLRMLHPDWTDAEVKCRARELFLYARS